MDERDRAERILANLTSVSEDLLALSDDLWHGINFRDQKEREQKIHALDQYTTQLDAYAKVAREVEAMIRRITGMSLEAAAQGTRSEPLRQATHGLDEDFTFTRPSGFVFLGQAYTDTPTWKHVYEAVCRLLAAHNPARWAKLPENPAFTSSQHRKAFSRDASDLRGSLTPIEGVYAEAHYSANSLRDNMVKLLDTFGLPPDALKVYLRQERDASE